MCNSSFCFLRIVDLIDYSVQHLIVDEICQLVEVVMAKMRFICPGWICAENLRSKSLERHVELKADENIVECLQCISLSSHSKHHSRESSVVVRWQIFLRGINHYSSWAEELLDEVCVVVEVGGEENYVVSILSAQQLIQERRLFNALLVEVCFKTVVGKCYNFIST